MADGGHFGFGALTDLARIFAKDMGANFFYLAFIEDKSTEKRTFALNGHRIALDDPTTQGWI